VEFGFVSRLVRTYADIGTLCYQSERSASSRASTPWKLYLNTIIDSVTQLTHDMAKQLSTVYDIMSNEISFHIRYRKEKSFMSTANVIYLLRLLPLDLRTRSQNHLFPQTGSRFYKATMIQVSVFFFHLVKTTHTYCSTWDSVSNRY